jgi:large subunit ribosomal protein L3
MAEGLLGTKVGMTAVYNEEGQQIPVTVVRTSGNKVVGKRTEQRDGYAALVLGYGDKPVRRATKPELGFFQKNGLVDESDGAQTVKRHIREFRLADGAIEKFQVGEIFAADRLFKPGDKVDVIGTSKGRGFTGVIKRWNFHGKDAGHGTHEYFRHGGSISSNTYPAHVFKNKGMPGQHGNARVTVQNVKVVGVLPEEGLILLQGGIPGPNGGVVQLNRAVKARS